MMKRLIILLAGLLASGIHLAYSQESQAPQENGDSIEVQSYDLDQLRASMYLNECAYSLTRILQSGNKIVLYEEQYKLNNTYRWEYVTDYSSVFNFRVSLQSQLNSLIINEINRERFKKEFERKQNSAARDAFLNAISGVQLNVSLVSIASNLLISSARAYMDYGKRKEELNVELDNQNWQLEQNHMTSITILRNELFNVINQTFGEYRISDRMFLREKHFEDFFHILSNNDYELKLVSLKENTSIYQSFPPFWFELGCCYIDNYEANGKIEHLDNAWKCFRQYEKMNRECPLFLTDERCGIIALYKLKYMKNLTREEILELIDTVKENISSDASALLYAALQYDIRLDSPDESLNMMRRCLDNSGLTGKNEFVLAGASIWNKVSSDYYKKLFIKAVTNASELDLNTYISFLYMVQKEGRIDCFPLTDKIQSSFRITCSEFDGDLPEKISVESEGNYFTYDVRDWRITLEDNNIVTGIRKLSGTAISLRDQKKFFGSHDEISSEIMNKNSYFKHYPAEIEKTRMVSRHQLGDHEYYYIPSEVTWSTILPLLNYKTSKTGKDTPDYQMTGNIETEFLKFHKKYAIEEIEYDFTMDKEGKEEEYQNNDRPRYTLRINVSQKENAEIDLLHISEEDAFFYFHGIEYNDVLIEL